MSSKVRRISMERKEPVSLEDVMPAMLRIMGLSEGMNEHLILNAWDEVTNAGQYTLNKYFRRGVLYCAISSSVWRNQLFFNRAGILDAINRKVMADPLFFTKDGNVPVKSLVLK